MNEDKEKVQAAAKNRLTFIKIYNRLCRKCKNKLTHRPGMPYEEYCKRCKGMIETYNKKIK